MGVVALARDRRRRHRRVDRGEFVRGEREVERAEPILADIDRLVDDAREQADAVRGVVRVTAPPELGALLWPA